MNILTPYSFTQSGTSTFFYYGDILIFAISYINNDLASAIMEELNIAFQKGHEMTIKSMNNILDGKERE